MWLMILLGAFTVGYSLVSGFELTLLRTVLVDVCILSVYVGHQCKQREEHITGETIKRY